VFFVRNDKKYPLLMRWRVLVSGAGGNRLRGERPTPTPPPERPSFLLVTLDTTSADAIGRRIPVETPAFTRLAERGLRFTQAYATAPQTLPSHASMLTGLYPAGHGVHENGRRLAAGVETVVERLAGAGYDTAAFVSGFPLDRQFGLDRGFALYDDQLGAGRAERSAQATTERALAANRAAPAVPLGPLTPARALRAAGALPLAAPTPYLGEIAAGRRPDSVAGFEERPRLAPGGGGDHGVARQHGEASRQPALPGRHAPLVLAAGIAPGCAPSRSPPLADTVRGPDQDDARTAVAATSTTRPGGPACGRRRR
jgi:hypothetical protein